MDAFVVLLAVLLVSSVVVKSVLEIDGVAWLVSFYRRQADSISTLACVAGVVLAGGAVSLFIFGGPSVGTLWMMGSLVLGCALILLSVRLYRRPFDGPAGMN